MKILLGRKEINLNWPDRWGKTPLSLAAENGHEGVVKILLGREEITPDKPDIWDRTPLMCATVNGHIKVIALLQPHDEAITPSASYGAEDSTS